MLLGKVIGSVWATRKDVNIQGYKIMLVQPINSDEEFLGDPIMALDTVGSGPGEIIIYITASEAVIPLDVDVAPVDASIIGIVDSINK